MVTHEPHKTAVSPSHALVMAPASTRSEPKEAGEWSWLDTAMMVAIMLATIAAILLAPTN